MPYKFTANRRVLAIGLLHEKDLSCFLCNKGLSELTGSWDKARRYGDKCSGAGSRSPKTGPGLSMFCWGCDFGPGPPSRQKPLNVGRKSPGSECAWRLLVGNQLEPRLSRWPAWPGGVGAEAVIWAQNIRPWTPGSQPPPDSPLFGEAFVLAPACPLCGDPMLCPTGATSAL